jgi:hypothetical protein
VWSVQQRRETGYTNITTGNRGSYYNNNYAAAHNARTNSSTSKIRCGRRSPSFIRSEGGSSTSDSKINSKIKITTKIILHHHPENIRQ